MWIATETNVWIEWESPTTYMHQPSPVPPQAYSSPIPRRTRGPGPLKRDRYWTPQTNGLSTRDLSRMSGLRAQTLQRCDLLFNRRCTMAHEAWEVQHSDSVRILDQTIRRKELIVRLAATQLITPSPSESFSSTQFPSNSSLQLWLNIDEYLSPRTANDKTWNDNTHCNYVYTEWSLGHIIKVLKLSSG